MAIYESEHTKFMREWLQRHPEEVAEAKAGRALWWDKKPRDKAVQLTEQDARVAQKPYYYDAN